MGGVGHGAGVGYGGTAGTRRSSGPRLLQRGLLVVEALRGSTPGSARLGVGAPRQVRLPPAHRRENIAISLLLIVPATP